MTKNLKNTASNAAMLACVGQLLATLAIAGDKAAPQMPRGCDLDIKPRVAELRNLRTIQTIEGALNYGGLNYWGDVALSLSTTTMASPGVAGIVQSAGIVVPEAVYVATGSAAGAAALGLSVTSTVDNASNHSPTDYYVPLSRSKESDFFPFKVEKSDDDSSWIAKAVDELKEKCNDELRDSFSSDVIEDDGREVITAHYQCSKVLYKNEGDSVRLMIEIQKGEPVFEELSLDQIAQRKCQRLKGCFARATKQAELDWVFQAQAALGCAN